MGDERGPAAMREERKVVTAVFADLVGSTALGERLDPEDTRMIVGEAVARIIRAVESFGGTVKDLAGDGVLALFGAPVAHEDDPERAIRASLRIADDIAGYGREVEAAWDIEGFAVRVGIDTGPVVVGTIGAGGRVEYAAVGDAVNTAARFQGHAEPGTVLVSEATRRTVESLFRWGERRELALKGKARPGIAWVVAGVGPAGGGSRGAETDQAPLVGRDGELAAATEAVDAVMGGAGGILFVTGEPGIGKSRLLAELRAYAAGTPSERPVTVLEGRCVSYGESLPYWPFRDLLRSYLGVSMDEPELRVRLTLRRAVDRLFDGSASEVYPYLGSMLGLSLEPEAAARLAELSPEALQYRTFEVVESTLSALAQDGPVIVALEDLHWADATSVQLVERLLPLSEDAAVLLVLTSRPERDHPAWALREAASRSLPHRTRELSLVALSGHADRELLRALVGEGTLPAELEDRIATAAEGNPFFLEELVRSLADAGALVREGDGWRFDHMAPVDLPPTVEKVILARIDRLPPHTHDVLTAASVVGRHFGLPLLEEVAGNHGRVRPALHELERLDLVREERRWPQPEYRFKHVLIQETAYRTLVREARRGLHRKAAEWLEGHYAENEAEVAGLLAHHWLAAEDEDKAVESLTRAGDRARYEYALDEAVGHYQALLPLLERRGERQEMAVVLFKLALALHTSMRFGEANEAYQRAFELWERPPHHEAPSATLRMAVSYVPRIPDPSLAGWWPDIQLCMQLFDRLVEAWPERTIVPSLAERWEISDDGLHYVFHLRDGLRWSDGEALTAHDVEYGIKRVLDPDSSGASVSIYFVLENGQDYYLRRNADRDRIGVRALDDRTVEFRLVAPAPYFMSVMNRPDGAPQPRHAIERDGDKWTLPERQVVSGPFRQAARTDDELVLVRQDGYTGTRPGNVARVEYVLARVDGARDAYARDELDVIRVLYTPRTADHVPDPPPDVNVGPAPSWSAYLGFDHAHPVTSNADFRRALAHAIDRSALSEAAPANLPVATGGIVPPALQGHTPDIALRFDPDRAREYLARSGIKGAALDGLAVAAYEEWDPMLRVIASGWKGVLGLEIGIRMWSAADVPTLGRPLGLAPIAVLGWLPGYPDPEYVLRLLLHSEAKTNEGGFADPAFDELIERARHERSDRSRLELFHQADRVAVADRVALIPLVYGRSMAFVKPWVRGWWEFGKTSASFADLVVER